MSLSTDVHVLGVGHGGEGLGSVKLWTGIYVIPSFCITTVAFIVKVKEDPRSAKPHPFCGFEGFFY